MKIPALALVLVVLGCSSSPVTLQPGVKGPLKLTTTVHSEPLVCYPTGYDVNTLYVVSSQGSKQPPSAIPRRTILKIEDEAGRDVSDQMFKNDAEVAVAEQSKRTADTLQTILIIGLVGIGVGIIAAVVVE
jgi:hypothetical protein